MAGWLRWPRLWYATPTFALFIALQAPDWRFTGRVYLALLVWSLAGVATDTWMTGYQRKPGAETQRRDVNRHLNRGVIFGVTLGICALVFRPRLDSVGHVAFAPVLNAALDWIGILLPVLDSFHHELLRMGRFDYAAYLGSFFMLLVVIWLVEFFLFYCSFARLSQIEFAKGVAAKKNYGTPPYGPKQRGLASAGMMLYAVLLPGALLLFGRILPADASHPAQSDLSILQTYVGLGLFGWLVNFLVFAFHTCRRFLSTLQPSGLLVAEEDTVPNVSETYR